MWISKDAERWMVQAERADPRVRNPGEAKPLDWPDQFIKNGEERRAVKLWVWCEAHGQSFRETVIGRGQTYTTWMARKNRGVGTIVMLLNLQDSLRRTGSMVAVGGLQTGLDT